MLAIFPHDFANDPQRSENDAPAQSIGCWFSYDFIWFSCDFIGFLQDFVWLLHDLILFLCGFLEVGPQFSNDPFFVYCNLCPDF